MNTLPKPKSLTFPQVLYMVLYELPADYENEKTVSPVLTTQKEKAYHVYTAMLIAAANTCKANKEPYAIGLHKGTKTPRELRTGTLAYQYMNEQENGLEAVYERPKENEPGLYSMMPERFETPFETATMYALHNGGQLNTVLQSPVQDALDFQDTLDAVFANDLETVLPQGFICKSRNPIRLARLEIGNMILNHKHKAKEAAKQSLQNTN